MFTELYADRDITAGGLFFDPETDRYIEVIDLDSAAGVGGATLVTKGGGYIDEDRIHAAVASAGVRDIFSGDLVSAWKLWADRASGKPVHLDHGIFEGAPLADEGNDFEGLPEDTKHKVLLAAELVFRYAGMDGPPDDSVLVIHRDQKPKERRRREMESEWGVHASRVSTDPRKTVWRILKEWGVEKPKE